MSVASASLQAASASPHRDGSDANVTPSGAVASDARRMPLVDLHYERANLEGGHAREPLTDDKKVMAIVTAVPSPEASDSDGEDMADVGIISGTGAAGSSIGGSSGVQVQAQEPTIDISSGAGGQVGTVPDDSMDASDSDGGAEAAEGVERDCDGGDVGSGGGSKPAPPPPLEGIGRTFLHAYGKEPPPPLEEYDAKVQRWLENNGPDAAWLARGETVVTTRGMLMMRIIGEPSACQAIGVRMGCPEADAIWPQLSKTWLDARTEEVVNGAPATKQSFVRRELNDLYGDLPEFLLTRLAPLRLLARELYKRRESLNACRAWDAWVSREPYSQLEVWMLALKSITAMLVEEGRRGEWQQVVCPVCYRSMNEPGWEMPWRSLHPCAPPQIAIDPRCARPSSRARSRLDIHSRFAGMHWLCDACEEKWTQRDENDTCPMCRTVIEFSREAAKPATEAKAKPVSIVEILRARPDLGDDIRSIMRREGTNDEKLNLVRSLV